MSKKDTQSSIDLKSQVLWAEILKRNPDYQTKMESIRKECAQDEDWDPIYQNSKRCREKANELVREIYGYELPGVFSILEVTDNRPVPFSGKTAQFTR